MTCLPAVAVQVEAKYVALARELMEFEKQASQKWLDSANDAAMAHMKLPVLREDASLDKCAVMVPHTPFHTILRSCLHDLTVLRLSTTVSLGHQQPA